MEKFLYGEEQKQFSKQKCRKYSQQMNKNVKKNQKIPPGGVIDGKFKVKTEPHFMLLVISATKVN